MNPEPRQSGNILNENYLQSDNYTGNYPKKDPNENLLIKNGAFFKKKYPRFITRGILN